MSRTFNTNSAKKAFGVFSEPLYASDYIYNKKAKTIFCNVNYCEPNIIVNTAANYLLLKRAAELNNSNVIASINKRNLYINLITKLNLTNVPVIKDMTNDEIPAHINTNVIPYLTYNIDPKGVLFGNTPCGLNNYLSYLEYDIVSNEIDWLYNNYS